MMMKKKILISLLLAAFCVLHSMAQDNDSIYAADLLKPGSMAPEFLINDVRGHQEAYPVTDYFAKGNHTGTYLVLDFWATWCGDCRREMPRMKQLYAEYAPKGVEFVGISFDTDRQRLMDYLQKEGIEWVQHSELKAWKETEISGKYHVKWIPTMYLIDPQGRVLLGTVMPEKLETMLADLEKEGLLQQRKNESDTEK